MMHTDEAEFGDDLSFTHLNPRPGCAGTWIAGRVAGHRFEALVFRDHAEDPAWEAEVKHYATARLLQKSNQK